MGVKRGFTIAANVILLINCCILLQTIMVELDKDDYLQMGFSLLFLSGIVIAVLTIFASSSEKKSLKIVSLIFLIILVVPSLDSALFLVISLIIAFIFQLIALVLKPKEETI